MIATKNIIVIALLFLTVITYAQDDNSDFATWSTIGVAYEANKKWDFGLEGQLRLDENSSEVDEYFTELSAAYKIGKGFYAATGLRYIRENDNEGKIQGYENHFRFNIDGIYKHKINDFSLTHRLRYQNKNELGVSKIEGDFANINLRLKTGVKYNIAKWPLDPKFSAEIFNHFQEGEEGGFNKFRLTIGTAYKLKKAGKISLFYRYQNQINTEEPVSNKILGFKYIYTFKN